MANYRDRIEIEEPIGEPDEGGHFDLKDDSNWRLYVTRKAEVIARTSSEIVNGLMVVGQTHWTVKMYDDSKTRLIHPSMRIKMPVEDRILQIESVHPLGNRNKEIVCNCIEVI